VVAADEIHQAEVERFDSGRAAISQTSRKAPWFRSVHAPGSAFDALAFFAHADASILKCARRQRCDLGQRHEGQALPAGDEDLHILLPVRMGDVVDARADPAVAIARHDEVGGHFGMFASAPAWAPSSQSQVMSKIGPSSFCSCRALRISFSEPA
jgi:hypothetical protein